jgi:hypothetical protein
MSDASGAGWLRCAVSMLAHALKKLLFWSAIAALEIGGGLAALAVYVIIMPFATCRELAQGGWPTDVSPVRLFVTCVIVPFSVWVLFLALL